MLSKPDQDQDKGQVRVTCGIIERNRHVLVAQRSRFMKMPLKWEFPGGKMDPGETPEAGLHRELAEELDIRVRILHRLNPVFHHYADARIVLYPFICAVPFGEPRRIEHAAIHWLLPDQLDRLDWAEADRPVLEAYRRWKALQP